MKLVRFGEIGKEKPGLLEEGGIIDVSAQTRDFDEDFFASGGLVSLENWYHLKTVRLGSLCSAGVYIIGLGL